MPAYDMGWFETYTKTRKTSVCSLELCTQPPDQSHSVPSIYIFFCKLYTSLRVISLLASLFTSAVLVPLAVHALSLTRSKLGRTRGVPHKVVNGIQSWLIRTSVRAVIAVVILLTSRRVINMVIIAIAATFKSVQETQPMSDFMGSGSLDSIKEHVASVIVQLRLVAVVRKCAEAVDATVLQERLVVEVERVVAALAKVLFHGSVVAILGPVAVDSPVCILKVEMEPGAVEAVVQCANAAVDVGLLWNC